MYAYVHELCTCTPFAGGKQFLAPKILLFIRIIDLVLTLLVFKGNGSLMLCRFCSDCAITDDRLRILILISGTDFSSQSKKKPARACVPCATDCCVLWAYFSMTSGVKKKI
uniref:Uncharacterized protein n=1 Tax=Glossina brevipalpis TaxID=37001 RepID=A0A1A9W840_9MUSC